MQIKLSDFHNKLLSQILYYITLKGCVLELKYMS